ncbi:hypothetical protein MMC13_005952 [Lambiella insularis]|nr:hypothetical protein [Lambiella insularis]
MQADVAPPSPPELPTAIHASSLQSASRPTVELASNSQPASAQISADLEKPPRGLSFWAIVSALCITSILTALENTVVTTSLPVIVQELSIGDNYVWITNVFFLTSAVVQPLFGQLANIFGRRWLTMFIVAVFTVGSAICGAANSGGALIAGRAIQGIGSGGLNMIVDVIVSDLVPLRERGNFIAIILTVYSIGTTLGPFVGGIIVQTTTWRWIFLINLPIGGAALVILFIFLHVKYIKDMTFAQKMKRIDFVGNAIIMASSVAILFALTYAGSRHAWSSWNTIVPLVVGLWGFILFIGYENSRFCLEPVIPPRLFANRTSAAVYINTFLNSTILYWVMYFLPVFFQAVLGSSPSRAGIQLFPIVLIGVPGAVIAVIVLSKFGRYKVLHHVGFALGTIALGLFTLLNHETTLAEWVIYEVFAGLGAGMVLNTLLPAFQAALDEKDQAAATASWAFIRSFGNIWGVAIPAAIFNTQIEKLSSRISNPAVRDLLAGGHGYQYGTAAFINSYNGTLQLEIVSVYSDALRLVWEVAILFSGLAFCLVFVERKIPLRTELDTAFGLKEKVVAGTSDEMGACEEQRSTTRR